MKKDNRYDLCVRCLFWGFGKDVNYGFCLLLIVICLARSFSEMLYRDIRRKGLFLDFVWGLGLLEVIFVVEVLFKNDINI